MLRQVSAPIWYRILRRYACLGNELSIMDPTASEAATPSVGSLGVKFYRHSGFMHLDLNLARAVSKKFPRRSTAFAFRGEVQPVHEVDSG